MIDMIKSLFKSIWKIRWLTAILVLGISAGAIIAPVMLTVRAKSIDVKERALSRYGGDTVSALIKMVDDPTNTFLERNYAIGMLANLSDVRALPVLQKHWTGSDEGECGGGHSRLCQYELMKAVSRSKENTGPNLITRLMQ